MSDQEQDPSELGKSKAQGNVRDFLGILGEGCEVITVSGPIEALELYHRRRAEYRASLQELITDDVAANLVPKLGRAGGEIWPIEQTIGFSQVMWQRLEEVALTLSTEGQIISPADVASYFVEKAMDYYGDKLTESGT